MILIPQKNIDRIPTININPKIVINLSNFKFLTYKCLYESRESTTYLSIPYSSVLVLLRVLDLLLEPATQQVQLSFFIEKSELDDRRVYESMGSYGT